MKRVMLMMVLAVLLLTQCRRPSIEFPSAEVRMTVTAGPSSKTDIYTTGGITWSAGDKIYVGCNGRYVGCLNIVNGVGSPTGTFTGTVTGVSEGTQEFHFFYLGSGSPQISEDEKTATVSFATQDIYAEGGKLKNANSQHVGHGMASGEVDGDAVVGLNVEMKSKVAIAYFHFESGEIPTPYTGALTLSGDHIYSSMTVGFGGTFSPGTKGDISLAGGHAQRYVMLVPPANVASETLNFSGGATGVTALENGIEANKFYRVDGSMPIVVEVEVEAPAHEIVNMGLPAPYENLEWSKYNLGVNPDDLDAAADWYGDFYAWGATDTWYSSLSPLTWKPGYSSGYAWETCPGNGGNSSYNKDVFATWKSENLTANNTLSPEVDAAHVIWGGDWRMPTTTEWKALYDNTTLEWVDSYEGVAVSGCLLKNKSDPSKELFLPAAGLFVGTSHNVAGTMGDYWSSTVVSTNLANAYRVYFGHEGDAWMYPQSSTNRVYGFPVRPVCQHQN